MRVRTNARVRLGLGVGGLLAALSLAGLSSPASADERDDLRDRIFRVNDVSSALAVAQGGYSLTREQSFDDGAFERMTLNFTVDKSYSEFIDWRLPNGEARKSGYIYDRRAKTQSWTPGRDEETRQALRLLQAAPDSWIVKPAPLALAVPHIVGNPAGVHLLRFFVEWCPSWRTDRSCRLVADDGKGSFSWSVRGTTSETKDDAFDVSMTLRSDGAVSAMQITHVTTNATWTLTWSYVAPVIEQPTGRAVIWYADFMRAKQAPKLRSTVEYFSYLTTVGVKSPSPAKLYAAARREVANWQGSKVWIPIKVSRIKWGARLSAVHPFTKERHMCVVVTGFPGADRWSQIHCKSGTKPWTDCTLNPSCDRDGSHLRGRSDLHRTTSVGSATAERVAHPPLEACEVRAVLALAFSHLCDRSIQPAGVAAVA